jgi:hypothetical protein
VTRPAWPSLAALPERVDLIDVFRAPANLPGHADEILALPWRPAVVWFQLGIRHDGAAERLARAGIRVVQDRCMMPEHRRSPNESRPDRLLEPARPYLPHCAGLQQCVCRATRAALGRSARRGAGTP